MVALAPNGTTGTENAGDKTGAPKTGPTGSDNGGGGGGPTDFFAGLAPENREFATKKGWKTADDAFKSHRELETAFSARGPNAQEYRLGDYAFNAPADPLAKAAYSPERAEGFKQFAQKTKLSPEQAAATHDWYVSATVEQHTQAQAKAAEALNAKFAQASTDLTKEWGVEEAPTFKRNAEVANRAIRELGLTEALTEMGALVPNPKTGKLDVANAKIVAALAKVGNAMFAEDSLFGSSSSSKNPFAVGTPDENATAAGQIIQSDPDKAEALIRAAGPQAINMYQHFLAKPRKK